MFPTAVLNAITPVLMAMPINKHLEAACKEAAKEIQKKAKSTPAKKVVQMAEGIACKQAGKATQTATKAFTGLGKKQLDKIKKDAEKDIQKKGADTSAGVALTGLRDEAEKSKKQKEALEQGKPMKLPRPMGGGTHVPLKFRVLTRDKIEVDLELVFGIDLKQIPKGKLQFTYGVFGPAIRF